MLLLGTAVAVMACTWSVYTPHAAAASSRQTIDSDMQALVSDDERYAAWRASPGVIAILDTKRGAKRQLKVDASCTPVDGGAGYFLVLCRNGVVDPDQPYLLKARAGGLRFLQTPAPTFDTYSAVGRYWLFGRDCGGGRCVNVYLNRRTGENRRLARADRPYDLNTPDLRLVDRDTPFALYRGGALKLFYRGVKTTLSECVRVDCASVNVGGLRASWAEGPTARGYVVSSTRRFSRRFTLRPGVSQTFGLTVRHTKYAILVAVLRTADSERRTLYLTSWS